jgi:hypothetical protein
MDLPLLGLGDLIKFCISIGFLYTGIFAITFRLYKVYITTVTNSVNIMYKDAPRGRAKPIVLVVLYTRI